MNNSDYKRVVDDMRAARLTVPENRVLVRVPNALEELKAAMGYFVSLEEKKLVWMPQYDRVADWLSDNKGRGLLLYGTPGQGKTLIGRYAIPAIFYHRLNLVANAVDATAINRDPDLWLTKKILSIDDIGVEDISNKYGNRRMVISEALDAAEKNGKLLILTSNLTKDQLIEKYGDRAFDRIIATTERIPFNGESLRR